MYRLLFALAMEGCHLILGKYFDPVSYLVYLICFFDLVFDPIYLIALLNVIFYLVDWSCFFVLMFFDFLS